MKLISIALGLVGIVLLPHLADAQTAPVDDPFSDYLQRSQSIFLGAGNAAATNEAVQMITPWPWYVNNTRIPGDGRRGVDAIEQMYRYPDPFGPQHGGAAPGAGSAAGGSSPTGAPVTPMQPLGSGY